MKKRLNRRHFLGISAGALAISGFNLFTAHAQSAVSTSISLNGSSGGRTFDGIGAISGGGGNSRLLIDYSDPYRSQILDYLFKPGSGANLHVLKVEIGGDTNSTDGSESSFMHTATDQNFNRGYEWWLMQEAKARNPNIKLYGLAWGAPGWIGTTGAPVWDTNNRIWSQDMVNYLIAWIKGAKSQYNLTIDYVGGWNERGYNRQFYEALHAAIQSNGLSTRVVGADSDWSIADAMISDSTFNASVDIVGAHYPCGYLGSEAGCGTTSNALNLNKPLWASENGSEDYNSGAQAMARAINRGYIGAKMTAYNNWPVIASIYDNLPYNTCGLIYANQPWAGYYSVGKQLWTTAHTTQFTQPGWHYLDGACGYLGGNGSNGSYVTLKSTNGSDYSVIIETVDATASQTVSFQVSNGLSMGTVSVWATNLNSSNASDYFVRQGSITPSGGAYSITLQPGSVYTLSTTTGQGKSTAAGSFSSGLVLPYSDNFDSYTDNQEARYFADQNGAFEIVAAGGGRTGKVMRQMCPIAPHTWDSGGYPNSLFGDLSWTDYTNTCDVLLEQPTSVQLKGCVGTQKYEDPTYINAYTLQVSNSGAWSVLKNSSGGSITSLRSGSVSALGTNSWHTLSLSFKGSTITAAIDGTTVGTVTDSSYGAGQVAIGVNGWQNVQFDNFSVSNGTPIMNGTGYAVNAGGAAGGSFAADELYGGGSTYSTTAAIDTSAVSNPAPQVVYQTERYNNFSYAFPKLVAGAQYTVRLHFAESYWTSSGQRLFNVAINGQQVLTSFDIYATAGAANKAVVEQFPATADASGQITIQFANVKDNAKVSGIEILASSSATPTPTPTSTSTPTATATPKATPTSTSTPTPTPTSGTGGGGCMVQYAITNQWSGGFGANVTITNTGTTSMNGWTLTWSFANGQTISQLWNGSYTQSGSTVSVTNLSYNGTIAPGSNTSFGFNGTWNNSTNAVPTSFALNGQTC